MFSGIWPQLQLPYTGLLCTVAIHKLLRDDATTDCCASAPLCLAVSRSFLHTQARDKCSHRNAAASSNEWIKQPIKYSSAAARGIYRALARAPGASRLTQIVLTDHQYLLRDVIHLLIL